MRRSRDRIADTAATAALALAGAVAVVAIAGGGCSAGPLDVADLVPSSLETGLFGHWTLDERAGTTVGDSSGNARNGTLTGGSWIAGRFGGALHFADGAVVSVPSFPQVTASLSVALWVRIASGAVAPDYVTFVSTETVFTGGWEMNATIKTDDVHYHFGYWEGPNPEQYAHYECYCVVRDRWTHVAAVLDAGASTLSFYRDGVLDGQSAVTSGISPGNTTLLMGRWSMDGRLFTGDLDDIAIYNRVLAPHEVAALATAPAPNLQ